MINATILGTVFGEVRTGKTANGKPYARYMIEWPKTHRKESDAMNRFPVIMYGKPGLHEYIKEGKVVAINGRIETGTFEKEGVSTRTHVLVADRVELEPDDTAEGFSCVMYIGNLFGDCTVRHIPNEKQTAKASWYGAVSREWDKDHPDSYPTELYGERAEKNGRKLVKGQRVAVVGSIETYAYKDKDGNWVNSWKVVSSSDANGITLLGKGLRKSDVTGSECAVSDPRETDDLSGFADLPDDVDDDYLEY